jgi:hypothetical protein
MKAPIAFDLVGVRVDGEDLVSKLTQATVYGVGGVGLGFPRNARDAIRFLTRNSLAASLMVLWAGIFGTLECTHALFAPPS